MNWWVKTVKGLCNYKLYYCMYFKFQVQFSIEIKNSAIGLKVCTITAGSKMYNSMIQNKRNMIK